MSIFKIIKKGTGNFWHVYNNNSKQVNLSDFEVVLDSFSQTFSISMPNGSNVPSFSVDIFDIIVVDETDESIEETFGSVESLRIRLIELGYTPYISGGGGDTLQQVTDNGNTTTNAIEVSNYIKASEFRSGADDITFTDGSGNPIFFFASTGANQANFDKALLTADRNFSFPDASGTLALQTPQYKFLLSQTGGDDPQTATSGTLTQGVTYEIVAFETGDDFTPSGAPNNTVGTKWIANGVSPTWSNGSEIGWNNGAPIIGISFGQSVNGTWFEKIDLGVYHWKSNGLFTVDKVFFPTKVGFAGSFADETGKFSLTHIDLNTILIYSANGSAEFSDSILNNCSIVAEIIN